MTKLTNINADGSFTLYDGLEAEVVYEDDDVIFTIYGLGAAKDVVWKRFGAGFVDKQRAKFFEQTDEIGLARDWAEQLEVLANNIYDVHQDLV